MASRSGAVHVVTTERTYNGKVYRTHLLRRSYRESGKVKNQTLANLSHLPDRVVELIRRALKGEMFVSVDSAFDNVGSWHHGHVEAVLRAMRRLRFEQLLARRRCRQRDLVVALVAGHILHPDDRQSSELADRRWWNITTLPQCLDVTDCDDDDLDAAREWLLQRQEAIAKRLAQRRPALDGSKAFPPPSPQVQSGQRVKICLCRLADYVEWHMRQAWQPLLVCDEDQKAQQARITNDSSGYSFQTLLASLSQIARIRCRIRDVQYTEPTFFEITTTPNDIQRCARELLETITI